MRNLDPALAAALSNSNVAPVILVQITFRSQTCYAWTGVGTLPWNGNNFLGVGSLGKIGAITEGVSVQADGTSLMLSGIDKTLYGECMTDLQLGASAKVWFALWGNGTFIGQPYLLFSGCVDQPSFQVSGETLSVTLALENKMVDLGRPRVRRYTSADQHLQYPDDTGFNWVPAMVDLALVWG